MKHHSEAPTVDDERVAAAPQPAATHLANVPPEPPRPPDGIPPNPPRPAGPPPTTAEVTVEPTPADELASGDPAHRRVRQATATAAATWLGFYRQPPSVRDAWYLSESMDRARIPAESGLLAAAWWIANWTERIVLFAVVLLLLVLAATGLWIVARPARRIGLYIVLAVVFVIPWFVGS